MEVRSPPLLNIMPSSLPVVYLSLCWILLKNAYGNLLEVWPLSGLSCGTSDEEEHFLCSLKQGSWHWPMLVISNPNDF